MVLCKMFKLLSVSLLKNRVNKVCVNGIKKFHIEQKICDSKTSGWPEIASKSGEKPASKKEGLDWREVVAEAEQLVGYPTPYLTLRSLFDDEIAKTAIQLRKLVSGNHPLLKSTKNLLFGSKYNLQSFGLVIQLVSKAAGFSFENFSDDKQISGILNSQRILSEIVEMKRNAYLIYNVLNICQKKENFQDVQDLLCKKGIGLLTDSLSDSLRNMSEDYINNDVVELINKGLQDVIKAETFGPRNTQNVPMPTHPKGAKAVEHYFWEQQNDVTDLNLETFLGQGKDEWIMRTMLTSGSVLGKACQGAMKLAHKNELERDAYILGGHLAILWQLYLDLRDFYVHPHSFSYVGAPVTIALWEYPIIYSIFVQSNLEKTEVQHRQLYYAVRSTRAMDYVTCFLENEIAAIFEISDKFPVEDARLALQKMAVTVYKEALEYIE